MNNKLFNATYEAIAKLDTKTNICKKYGITRGQLNWAVGDWLRETPEDLELRHQMLLGAKLGDGYFQCTKHGTYKYRESHSIGEIEYSRWKYLLLKSLKNGTKIISKNDGDAVELYTSNSCSSSIKPYYSMSVDEVIEEINIYGLLFYLMDDGWYSPHSKEGNFLITSTILSSSQKSKIIEKFAGYGIKTNLIGKREDISIDSKYNYTLLTYLMQIAPTMELDIIKKKFGKVVENLNKYTCGIVYSDLGNQVLKYSERGGRQGGYLGENFWNVGRTKEIKNRVLHL